MTSPASASAGQLTERVRDIAGPSGDPEECPDSGRHGWDVEPSRAERPEPHSPRHAMADRRPVPQPVETSATAVSFSRLVTRPATKIELPSLDGYVPVCAAENPTPAPDAALNLEAPRDLAAPPVTDLPDTTEPVPSRMASFELPTYVPAPYDGHTAASYAAALKAGGIETDALNEQHDDKHVELRTAVVEPSPDPAAPVIAGTQRAKQARPPHRRPKAPRSDRVVNVRSPASTPPAPAPPAPAPPAPAPPVTPPSPAPPHPSAKPIPTLALPTYIPDPYDGTIMAYQTSTLTPITKWNAAAALRARRARLRRRKWIAAAVTVLLAGAGAGVAYRVLHHGSTTSPWTLPVGSGVSAPAGTLAPGPGLAFHSVAGHFAVRLAKPPVEQITKSSASGQSVTTVIASLVTARTVVQEATIAPGIDAAAAESFLSGVLHGVSRPGVITLATETAAAFRGRPARMGTYVTKNGPLTVLTVLYGTQRSYLLMAPSGAVFTALQSSFVPLQ